MNRDVENRLLTEFLCDCAQVRGEDDILFLFVREAILNHIEDVPEFIDAGRKISLQQFQGLGWNGDDYE